MKGSLVVHTNTERVMAHNDVRATVHYLQCVVKAFVHNSLEGNGAKRRWRQTVAHSKVSEQRWKKDVGGQQRIM